MIAKLSITFEFKKYKLLKNYFILGENMQHVITEL